MSTFSLQHGQFSTPFISYTSPFLHPKSTFCLSRPLTRTSSLHFRPILPRARATRSPLPVQASLSRFVNSDQPVVGHEDEDDPFVTIFNNPEPEDVSRRRSWTERGWAPWEEILSPEAEFARHSLDEGEEVPLTSPEAIEAFKMLTPSYRKKKIAEMGEEEYLKRVFAIKGEIPDKLKTIWAGPLALRLVPPRDWPPKGWEVDKAELEFIREAHKLQSERVDVGGGNWIGDPGFEESLMEVLKEGKEILDSIFEQNKELEAKFKKWVNANPDRLKVSDARLLMKNDFLEQFKEWISLNKGESSEGEDVSGVEKAVKRYEEFLKQLKERDNANVENAKQEASDTVNSMAFERYKVFLKQYTEWVESNRDKLEEESYKVMVKFSLGVWKKRVISKKNCTSAVLTCYYMISWKVYLIRFFRSHLVVF